MLTVKLIYLLTAIVSGVFFVLYRDALALILFVVIAAIPIILLLSILGMRLGLSADATAGENIITRGTNGHVRLNIANKFILPITRIRVAASFKNSFFDTEAREELAFHIGPLSSKSFDIEVNSTHLGNVEIELRKLKVFDYFGIFSLPVKLHHKFNFQIIPQVVDVDLKLSQNMYTLSESNVFSKSKPGDDPSEVFQIRDFVGGDKLNRIHWKLSSKQGSYMVKDYSLPVSAAVLIAIALCCDLGDPRSLTLADTVLEAAFSLSNMFIDRETVHSLGWYNSHSGTVYTQKIESLDDLFSAFGLIYNSTTFYAEPYMAQLDQEIQQNMSHVIYIAPNIGERHLELLSSTASPACIFGLLDAINTDGEKSVPASDEFAILPLRSDRIGHSLSDVVL